MQERRQKEEEEMVLAQLALLLTAALLLIHLPHVLPSASPFNDASVRSAQRIFNLVKEELKDDKHELPLGTICYAQTIDGSIAPMERTRMDISSRISFQLLHSLRSEHDVVLVGINTVVCDQPRLNVRDPLPCDGSVDAAAAMRPKPRPAVLDSDLKILDIPNQDIKLLNPIICTCIDASDSRYARLQQKLTELGGGTILTCQRSSNGKCDLENIFRLLKSKLNMRRVLVEGGAGIIQSALEQRLVQRVVVTIRPCYLGGYRTLTHQLQGGPLSLQDIVVASVDGDIVVFGKFNGSSDMLLARKPVQLVVETCDKM